jgi:hypothetical protein
MKIVLTKFLTISSVALLMLSSCKKDETKAVATSGKPGSLTASATTIVLDKTKLNDNAVTFTASPADFGYKAAISNILQVDINGDNFANAKEYNLPAKTLTQSFTVLDFNNLMLKLNLPTEVASPVQIRIKSQIGSTITPVYSNVVAMTVTPFALKSFVYVPGNYEGWANPGPLQDSLQSATNNGIYTGIINFKQASDQFLITPAKKWDNKYATNDPAGTGSPIVYNTIYVTGGGNNFYSASKATVDPNVPITSNLLVLDVNKNTLTLTPTLWSIVGDGSPGGWPAGSGFQSDTDMKFNNGTLTWSAVVDLIGGKAIKFRLNHDWGTNLGGSNGTLSLNGDNITVPADGTYLVVLDAVANTYTLTKQ